MNKKIIALLVVVALATTGVFATGLGVMSSAQTGWGAISYAPSKTGMYYGLGWGAHGIGISAEIPFVNGTFFDADLFSLGYRVGAGINTWLNFIGGFGFGVGVYGLAGLNFNFDFQAFELELFGQWQPNFDISIVPFSIAHNTIGSILTGYASGVRIWF